MTDDTGSLIYAVLLLVLVASSLFARRLPLGETLKMALTWVLIFAALFVVFTFRSDLKIVWDRVATELGLNDGLQEDGDEHDRGPTEALCGEDVWGNADGRALAVGIGDAIDQTGDLVACRQRQADDLGSCAEDRHYFQSAHGCTRNTGSK